MIKFEILVTIFKISATLYIFFLSNQHHCIVYLHRTHCRIYVLISPKSNKNIVVHGYHDNILALRNDNYETLLSFDFYILFF